MNLLKLFNPREEPAATYEHAVLGPMRWVPSEHEWEGSYNGYKFTIPREKGFTPSDELSGYAVALLGNSTSLAETLEVEKRRWVTKYPSSFQEVQPLCIESFALYRHKNVCRALVLLQPESLRNSWRIEFNGLLCEGLGFDS